MTTAQIPLTASTNQRSYEVDVIRMAALIGICMVNIPFLAFPMEAMWTPAETGLNKAAVFFIEAFFQLKFFLLFSFIFGWGMAIQQKSAERKGHSFSQRYLRRTAGLLLLGLAHASLVFHGDILVLYGVMGGLLWFARNASARTLMKIAGWMMPLSMLFLALIGIAIDMVESSPELMPAAQYSLGGGFVESVLARVEAWPSTFIGLVFLQGPLVFAAFAAGLAAGRSNFFKQGNAGFQRLERLVPWLLVIAIPLNILFAMVMGDLLPSDSDWLALIAFIGIGIGAPALSAVYLYGLVRLGRAINLPQVLVLAGQNSLSSYVLQGVLGGFVFAGYGLGLFDQLGQFALLGVAFIIALIAMLMVGCYAKVFGRGPLEPVLRKIAGN
ncbi:DUF418 domain-containing protein [Salinibius halmophilus]|uniref:DUF418 domain-containing protein n=1 Tax=Salinibius halmophilus TaxID=1853216 RepID=UPI000E6747DD|nr:DUF418 domain-containing protein [Salinibius halmophilus]